MTISRSCRVLKRAVYSSINCLFSKETTRMKVFAVTFLAIVLFLGESHGARTYLKSNARQTQKNTAAGGERRECGSLHTGKKTSLS